jgi:hypothetical protein
MKISKPVAVHVDRLVSALAEQGIDVRRTKALELVAAAFGFHNTHECTAASKRGDLTPPAARPVCRIEIPGGEALIVLRDPVSDAPYAIDETFVEQVVEDGRREAYGPSPYGRLLDLSAVGDDPATAWSPMLERQTAQRDGSIRILVELDTDGPVSADVVRDSVHNAIVFQRAEHGLSADEDEGMVGGIRTRILGDEASTSDSGATDHLLAALRSSGRTDVHVAVIHNRHGVELRLGTTLAAVSRQVGDYVRENWDDAWQADQNAEECDRADVPETPDGLDDDRAEEMYFQAVNRFSASDYVDYEVIALGDAPAPKDAVPAAEPFPGVPADHYTVNASRDGDVINTTFRLNEGENEEDRGREIAAESFGLKLDDYYDDDHGDDDGDLTDEEKEEAEEEAKENRNQNFDADIDSIEIARASFDDMLLPILETSWAAAQKLPAGDPLRDVIRRQIMDAMPKPEGN